MIIELVAEDGHNGIRFNWREKNSQLSQGLLLFSRTTKHENLARWHSFEQLSSFGVVVSFEYFFKESVWFWKILCRCHVVMLFYYDDPAANRHSSGSQQNDISCSLGFRSAWSSALSLFIY